MSKGLIYSPVYIGMQSDDALDAIKSDVAQDAIDYMARAVLDIKSVITMPSLHAPLKNPVPQTRRFVITTLNPEDENATVAHLESYLNADRDLNYDLPRLSSVFKNAFVYSGLAELEHSDFGCGVTPERALERIRAVQWRPQRKASPVDVFYSEPLFQKHKHLQFTRNLFDQAEIAFKAELMEKQKRAAAWNFAANTGRHEREVYEDMQRLIRDMQAIDTEKPSL